jgi:lipopolysaccharide transport system permease protein
MAIQVESERVSILEDKAASRSFSAEPQSAFGHGTFTVIHRLSPHLIIKPKRSRVPIDLGELWHYRELFYFLTWKDIKIRYRQTVLGATWAIVQPLFSMLLFTLLFGKLAGMPSDNIPYPLFAYAGLLPWTFFANAITNSGNSVVASPNLITKVYFPRMIIPGAAVFAGLVDLAVAFVILIVLMALYRIPLSVGFLLLPPLVLLLALMALGIGMWLSALNVKYRDIRYAIPFLVQFWMFATPIIYPASLLPERFRLLYALNPMTGIIEAFRAALFGGFHTASFDWRALAISTCVAVLVLIYAAHSFRKMEQVFADLI